MYGINPQPPFYTIHAQVHSTPFYPSHIIFCLFPFLCRYTIIGSSIDSAHSITAALRDLYKVMDKTPESLPPIIFIQVCENHDEK